MEWSQLKERLSAYQHTITECCFEEAVTSSMPRTFLLGNGDIALVSSGKEGEKEYLLAKGDFWSCGDLKTDAVMEQNPRRVTPLTIGRMQIKGLPETEDFEETLDLSDALLKTRYGAVTIRCFCYSQENVVVLRLVSRERRRVEFCITMKDDVPEYPAQVLWKDGNCCLTRTSANFAEENPLSWTSRVAVTARCADFSEPEASGSSVSYGLMLEKDCPVDILVALGGGGRTYDYRGNLKMDQEPWEQAADLLRGFLPDLAFQKHRDWWRDYWMKSYVFLSDFKLEEFYYGSLYLMACCSRENKLSPGLYGNFITTDYPKWNGDFHMNYNFIAPFYGMYKANRPEFARPLKDPMLDFIPEGERRAREDLEKVSPAYIRGGLLNGQRFPGREDLWQGIENAVLYPVALGPYGAYTWNEDGGYLSQMNDCAFTCMGLTAYYFYTLDREYLQEIEKLLRMNVNFFLAWREKETFVDGSYRYNLWSGAHEETMELNSPHVLASIKNILSCLLDGVRRGFLKIPEKDVLVMEDFYEHLPEYPRVKYRHPGFPEGEELEIIALGEKGAVFQENAATVALEFIHPGEDMHFASDEKVKEAARNVVELHRRINGEIFRQVNNLPKIFVHGVRAGYDAEELMEEFKKVLERDFVYNYSVRDFGNAHGIEKAGAMEFIGSMLLDSDMETVKVFPNFPKDRDAEFCCLLARGAFLVSAAYSGSQGVVKYVEITSLVQERISLVNPFRNPSVRDEKGEEVSFVPQYQAGVGAVLSFTARRGERYLVRERQIV